MLSRGNAGGSAVGTSSSHRVGLAYLPVIIFCILIFFLVSVVRTLLIFTVFIHCFAGFEVSINGIEPLRFI